MMQEIDMEFNLPWSVVCAVACRAFLMGISFEQLIVLAMRDYIASKT
jgi:hypothetical protein